VHLITTADQHISGMAGALVGGRDLSTGVTDLDRSNVVPGQIIALDNPSPNAWFNTKAVVLQGRVLWQYRPQRDNRPGFFSVDFAIKKNFYFTEPTFLQFRFDAFNFLNHPNFADSNTNVTNNPFGTITATKTGINMRSEACRLVSQSAPREAIAFLRIESKEGFSCSC
jgi:hypothetical protein